MKREGHPNGLGWENRIRVSQDYVLSALASTLEGRFRTRDDTTAARDVYNFRLNGGEVRVEGIDDVLLTLRT